MLNKEALVRSSSRLIVEQRPSPQRGMTPPAKGVTTTTVVDLTRRIRIVTLPGPGRGQASVSHERGA